MHHVAPVDWSFAETPLPTSAMSSGLARSVIVGPKQGAVHTELAVGALAPGGWLARHVHSFEEALYVLAGELVMDIGGAVHRLEPGDYAFVPIGTWHALGNGGSTQVRWVGVNTPQRLPPDADRRDTFFSPEAFDLAALAARSLRPRFGHPTTKYVGHYDGTPPQLEALRVDDPVRERRPVGMDTALLAYSGISVKMLVDRGFGADLLTMFTVDYEAGGAAQAHDHPFEETYFFLDGSIEAEIDGTPYVLQAGDVVFAGVGGVHGFWNTGSGRVRWLETQAPQPPARHSYRWVGPWKAMEQTGGR
jgi:quercetin dioxygenase-like cupin family protein